MESRYQQARIAATQQFGSGFCTTRNRRRVSRGYVRTQAALSTRTEATQPPVCGGMECNTAQPYEEGSPDRRYRLEDTMLSEVSRPERDRDRRIHSPEVPRGVTCPETDQEGVGARGRLCKGDRVSVLQDERSADGQWGWWPNTVNVLSAPEMHTERWSLQ